MKIDVKPFNDRVRFASPIRFKRLKKLSDDKDRLAFLRATPPPEKPGIQGAVLNS
jgi:hypothetical protein